jgi:hypothetical protein
MLLSRRAPPYKEFVSSMSPRYGFSPPLRRAFLCPQFVVVATIAHIYPDLSCFACRDRSTGLQSERNSRPVFGARGVLVTAKLVWGPRRLHRTPIMAPTDLQQIGNRSLNRAHRADFISEKHGRPPLQPPGPSALASRTAVVLYRNCCLKSMGKRLRVFVQHTHVFRVPSNRLPSSAKHR